MNEFESRTPEARLKAVLDFIARLASGHRPTRLPEWGEGDGDALDQIAAQLNALAER